MSIKNLKNLTAFMDKTSTPMPEEVLLVNIDDVISKPQVRTIFKNIDELAATIKSDKQQTPISVSPLNADGKYVILKGERRWRACKMLGMDKIKVIVDNDSYTETDVTYGELIENIQREDLTPIEIAHALKKLVDAGATRQAIHEKLGKSLSYISLHLSMLEKLPDCIAKLIEKQPQIAAQTVTHLKSAFKLNPKLTEEACRRYEIDGISRSNAKNFLDSLGYIEADVDSLPQATESAALVENNEKPHQDIPQQETTALDDPKSFIAEKEAVSNLEQSTNTPTQETLTEGQVSIVLTEDKQCTPVKRPVSLAQIAVSRKVDGKTQLGFLSLEYITGDESSAWVNCNGELVVWPTSSIHIEGIYED